MVRSCLAILALLAAGCSFQGEVGTGYKCGEGDTCPDGQSCLGGYCVSQTPPDADPSVPDAEPGAPVCGSLWLLADDFIDGDPGPLFGAFNDLGVVVMEVGGRLVIGIAGGAGAVGGRYESSVQYDFREGGLEVEVVQLGGQQMAIELYNHLGQSMSLHWQGGNLSARVSGAVRASVPYDAAAVYWRIRNGSGVTTWEVSADHTSWTELHAEATPFDVAHVRAVMMATGALAETSNAQFESINVDAPDVPGFCDGDTLVDDFASAPLPPTWLVYDNGTCTIDESAGKLQMTYDGVGSVFCGLVGHHFYDFTDAAMVIDSSELPTKTNFVSYFQLVSPITGETRIELSQDSGTLYAVNRIEGVQDPLSSTPYTAAHRYWRIRGIGEQVELATSPDGTAWTPRLTTIPGFPLDRVFVNLGAGHYDDVTPAGNVTALVPGVNAP